MPFQRFCNRNSHQMAWAEIQTLSGYVRRLVGSFSETSQDPIFKMSVQMASWLAQQPPMLSQRSAGGSPTNEILFARSQTFNLSCKLKCRIKNLSGTLHEHLTIRLGLFSPETRLIYPSQRLNWSISLVWTLCSSQKVLSSISGTPRIYSSGAAKWKSIHWRHMIRGTRPVVCILTCTL